MIERFLPREILVRQLPRPRAIDLPSLKLERLANELTSPWTVITLSLQNEYLVDQLPSLHLERLAPQLTRRFLPREILVRQLPTQKVKTPPARLKET